MIQIEDNRLFVDTNVLVYSTLISDPLYQQSNQRISALMIERNEIWISRQIIREYLVTMTRPAIVADTVTLESVLPLIP